MRVRIEPGINEELMDKTREKVRGYLREIVEDFVEIDGIFSFSYGSVTVNVEILPWHRGDVLVKVFSYLGENLNLSNNLVRTLLELNSRLPLGAFAIGIDDSVLYRYTLTGANLDLNEFAAAVYTVATVADSYDEFVKEYTEGLEKRLD